MIEISIGTIDYSKTKILFDTKDDLGFLKDKDVIDGQNIEIPPNFKAAVTVSHSRDTGELLWANAVMGNEVIRLEYDYNYHNIAFQQDPQERMDEPYRAVIGIESKERIFAARSIWYDKNGQATAVRTDTFDPKYLSTNFKRKDGNAWDIFYFGDNAHWKAKIIQSEPDQLFKTFMVGTIDSGKVVIVDEYSYCLQSDAERIRLKAGPVLNPNAFVLEAPSSINLIEYSEILSGENWAQIATNYPIRVNLNS